MIRKDTKILHIESSSVCNAACPMCARNINGNNDENLITASLTLEWFSSNISEKEIKFLDKIFFCGNLGDPCAAIELLDIISYIKKANNNITVGINTNGSIRNQEWWSDCAALLSGIYDYVVFSIDGLEDTNHLYRKNVSWDKIISNAKSFINAGGTAHWDMLVFDHNKHQVDKCLQLATDLGFSWFRVKETDRWDIYKDTNLTSPSEYLEFDYNSITEINCERNRENSEYIDSYGKVWPCCHIAEAVSNKVSLYKNLDLLEFSSTELCKVYQEKLDNNNPFYVCKRSCGVKNNKRSQWKKEICIK